MRTDTPNPFVAEVRHKHFKPCFANERDLLERLAHAISAFDAASEDVRSGSRAHTGAKAELGACWTG